MLNNAVCLSLQHHHKGTEHYLMPWNEWSWQSIQVNYHIWRTLPVKGCLLCYKLERHATRCWRISLVAPHWCQRWHDYMCFAYVAKIVGCHFVPPLLSEATLQHSETQRVICVSSLLWLYSFIIRGWKNTHPSMLFWFPKKCGLFSQKHSLGCFSSLRSSKVK